MTFTTSARLAPQAARISSMLRMAWVVCAATPPSTSSMVPALAPSMPDTKTCCPAITAWQNAGSRATPSTLTFCRAILIAPVPGLRI